MLFTNPTLFAAEAIHENRTRLRFNPDKNLLESLLHSPDETHEQITLALLRKGDIDAYLTTLLAGSFSSETEKLEKLTTSPTTSYERFPDNLNLAKSLLNQSLADNLLMRFGIFYDAKMFRFIRNDLEVTANEISKYYNKALVSRNKSRIGLDICLALEELSRQTKEYLRLFKSIRDTSFRLDTSESGGLELDLS